MNNDIVTAVKTSRKGALVTVNHGQEILFISRESWLERPFSEGDFLDLEELKAWLLPRQYPEALNYAVSLLALRARSTGELKKKLLERHYMDDTADMVLYKLEKEHFVDDDAFARDTAAQLSRRKLGSKRIFLELRKKGIPQEMAQEAIGNLDEEETADVAVELAQKLLRKYSREADPRKAMQKLMAAMARRGYGFDEARQAVEAAMESMITDDE